MTRIGDYRDDVFAKGFADQDEERIISGSPPEDLSLTDLAQFVSVMRSEGAAAPNRAAHDLVEQAAQLARLGNVSVESRTPKPVRRSDRRLPRRLSPVLATAALLGSVLVGLPAFAVMTDASSPGNALYPIDRALEALGIGDGDVDERIIEADSLMSQGAVEDGMAHLEEAITNARNAGDTDAADKAQRHLELAREKSNPDAASTQLRVAEKKLFIELNKGPNGVSGADFGQGVSDLARAEQTDSVSEPNVTEPEVTAPSEDLEPKGNSGRNGPPDHSNGGKGNKPDDAGPPEGKGPKGDR